MKKIRRNTIPLFFEMLFFISMLWFQEKRADYIILETGMGGRLDATNVIEKPLVTVITRIGLDHTEYLGNTKAEIAAEKAGIIKKRRPCRILGAGRRGKRGYCQKGP